MHGKGQANACCKSEAFPHFGSMGRTPQGRLSYLTWPSAQGTPEKMMAADHMSSDELDSLINRRVITVLATEGGGEGGGGGLTHQV